MEHSSDIKFSTVTFLSELINTLTYPFRGIMKDFILFRQTLNSCVLNYNDDLPVICSPEYKELPLCIYWICTDQNLDNDRL